MLHWFPHNAKSQTQRLHTHMHLLVVLEAPACPVEGDKPSMSVGNQGNYAISNNMNCHQVCCHVNVYPCPAALPSIYSVSL